MTRALVRILAVVVLGGCGKESTSSPPPTKAKDPVCGMEVEIQSALTLKHDGKDVYFCSERCKTRFQIQDSGVPQEEQLRKAKLTKCMAQVKRICEKFRMDQMDGKLVPALTGKQLVLAVAGMELPTQCPFRPKDDVCSYRGSKGDPTQLRGHAVVLCDDPANHPDGSLNVAYADGEIVTAQKDEPAYKEALDRTESK
jgi:YHS domain-containing protein